MSTLKQRTAELNSTLVEQKKKSEEAKARPRQTSLKRLGWTDAAAVGVRTCATCHAPRAADACHVENLLIRCICYLRYIRYAWRFVSSARRASLRTRSTRVDRLTRRPPRRQHKLERYQGHVKRLEEEVTSAKRHVEQAKTELVAKEREETQTKRSLVAIEQIRTLDEGITPEVLGLAEDCEEVREEV